jgi:hypothetical protein
MPEDIQDEKIAGDGEELISITPEQFFEDSIAVFAALAKTPPEGIEEAQQLSDDASTVFEELSKPEQ